MCKRRLPYGTFVLIMMCAVVKTKAQSPHEVLELAIKRMGEWQTVSNLSLQMTSLNIDKWQGYDYNKLVFQRDQWELKLDISSGDFLNHTVDHYPGGYVFNTYRLGLDSVYRVYDGDRSGTGSALINLGKALYALRSKSFLLSFFPYYILRSLARSEHLVMDSINNAIVIKGSGREYWLNKSSLLLEKSVNIRDETVNVQTFENYVEYNNLLIPGRSAFSVGDKITGIETLVSFKVNLSEDALGLKLPLNYNDLQEYNGPPMVRRLSKSAYLIEKVDGDRNVIFYDMGAYVILTEAPVSAAVVKEVVKCVERVLPGKPVKYVHLSHFHQDHIAGISELSARGATIICTPETVRPVTDLISQSTSAGGDAPRFLLIRKKLVLGRPGNTVEFYAVANSHAKGMSLAYLPVEQVIFQGDLLSLPEDKTITPPIKVNGEFFQFIRRLRLPYKTIIGHHGLSEIVPADIAKINKLSSKNH